MRNWNRFLVWSGVLMSLTTSALAETYNPRVGEPHVNFTLPAIGDGRPISLEQMRGRKVLLIQFASW